MTDATSLLAAQGIVAGYEPGLPIVNGASLEVAAGEILAVLGPNGAGKSTFIKALAGVVPITFGRVMLGEEDITHLPAYKRLGRGLAFVPQTENIFAGMTIADNLRVAGDVLPERWRVPERMAAMYDAFPDLARQRKLIAGRLSGGQRQMLAVARALMATPRVLMLDEPSAGLSPKLVAEVFDRLKRIRDTGVAIILVEQNVRAALAIADRALILVEGRNRFDGTARGLSDHEDIGALYLGRGAGVPGSGIGGSVSR